MLNISRETLLAKILKVEEDKVKEALGLTNGYKIVKVPKKKGGYRTLYIPPELLKEIQKRLYKFLLRKVWKECYAGLFGIYRGTSYIEHAKWHKEAEWVFQFDLEDAFPSVNVSALREILYEKLNQEMVNFEVDFSAYQELLKRGLYDEEKYLRKQKREVLNSALFPLKDLMVKEEDQWYINWAFPQREEITKNLTDLIIELTSYQEILPQGTPTAPFLFYLALSEKGLFAELQSICPLIYPDSQDRYDFRLSAYIDNFVVSAQKPIPLKNQEELFKIVEEFGFNVNPKKTRHQGVMYGAPLITGLRITKENGEGKVVLSKRKIRRWRGLIHRAIFEPDLRPKVKGLIASLKSIYGEREIIDRDFFSKHGRFPRQPILPSQLEKPYHKLLQMIE